MSYEKSFYQVFKCFSSDKFDYDEDAVLFASKSLGDCHNFAYQLWIEREDDNVFVTIIQPYDGSCRGGYGFPDEEEKPSEIKQLQAENAALRAEVEQLTRQRDLAVSALQFAQEKITELHIEAGDGDCNYPMIDDALDAIKESEV